MNKPLFPIRVPRALRLTSPLTHGQDVKYVQQAINLWHQRGNQTPTVKVDGVFGPATQAAAQQVAWSEGLQKTDISKNTIRLIWHPWMRNIGQKRRAADRAKHPHGVGVLPLIAEKYIGVTERPPGSNRGNPYPSGWERNFGIDGEPWCGAFAGSVANAGGGHVTDRVVYCPYIRIDALHGVNGFEKWTQDHLQAGPGWLVLYDWDGDGIADHVEIVESFQTAGLTTIGGNTSFDDSGSQSNGGAVARRHRGYGPVMGYAKPRI